MKTGLHLKDAVLAHMPEEFNSLVRQSNVSEGHDMLSAPNLDAHVFVRVLEDRGAVNLDPEGCVRRTELGFLGELISGSFARRLSAYSCNPLDFWYQLDLLHMKAPEINKACTFALLWTLRHRLSSWWGK